MEFAEAGWNVTTGVAPSVLLVGGRPIPPDVIAALLGVEASGEGGDEAGRQEALERLATALREAGFEAETAKGAAVGAAAPLTQGEVLLNAIGEGVCLSDRRGRVLWSNRFFDGLEEPVRAQVVECLRQAAEWFASRSAMQGGAAPAGAGVDGAGACKFEIEGQGSGETGPGGEKRSYELYATPAPDRPGLIGDLGETAEQREHAEDRAREEGAQRVAGVVRDVSAQRRVVAKMKAIDRAGYELVRLDADAIRQKNTIERLRLLEEKIVRLTREVLKYDHFAIFLIDEHTNRKLEMVISAGLPPEVQDLELMPELEGSGISGFVAATGESYICRDAQTDQKFLPGLAGARSSLTVPLRLHDRVIGVMDVEAKQPDAFDDDEQQFLEIFARHVALALHMLDLLVVERSTTNESVSGRVGDEIGEPLDDILTEIEQLESESPDRDSAGCIARIREDVESIRRRLHDVTSGPNTLLGVERAISEGTIDELLMGRRVLVADDVVKIRQMIARVLRAKGCNVTCCGSGEDAMDACRQVEQHELIPFDLIISDIRMPDRNGYEVFASARQAMPGVPVILMTGFGYDPHHSIVRASQSGLQSVLFKPFDAARLLDEVRKAVRPEG